MKLYILTKLLIILLLVLCHGICQAQDLPGNQKKANTLTVKQAAEIVKKANETRQRELDLSWLTSIDRDIARELSHYKGLRILLGGLTSIDANVAHELTKRQLGGQYAAPTKGLSLNGLTSITKDVAHELVKKANETQQRELNLNWLTSIDRDVARELSHYGGQNILLDGLTSLTQDVAHELTKVQPGRFGWYNHLSLRSDIPAKSLSLDGLTSITKEVAHELAKCNGSLNLNYVKSMDNEVARELAKFQGDFLNIQFLESIAPEDMNILKDGLRGRGGSEKFYRAMMPYKLNDGTMVKKWNGKIIEYRKDGSKMRETDYKYGGVTLRMEWDEAGNLTKDETYPVHEPSGVGEQSLEVKEQDKEPLDNEVRSIESTRLTNSDGLVYVKGEKEPFTGISGQYWRGGSKRQHWHYKNGKRSLRMEWDKDGNLVEKETF
ncbi:hypothetical protein OAK44_00685 [bacterium]|nr:hypothetical protein [bacterium]